MGPLAALYDVPGNSPALDAAELAGARDVVVGGDVVLGPMPRETLARLIGLGPRARVIRGNCDRLVVDAYDGRLPATLPQSVRETIAWTAGQLDRAHRDFLAALPETLAAEAPGLGHVLFCHGTPRSDDEIITARTPGDELRRILSGVTQRVVVCGHTHMQFDRTAGAVRVVNAGSVGMPYGQSGAYWLLLGGDVQLRRTDYDRERAATLIRGTAYPQADDFAATSVLNPPTAAAMLAVLEAARARSPAP